MVAIGPGENLFLREPGEVLPVPDSALPFQEPGQRGAAGETAGTFSERSVDTFPFFIRAAFYLTRVDDRPGACRAVMPIGPGENLLQGQVGQVAGSRLFLSQAIRLPAAHRCTRSLAHPLLSPFARIITEHMCSCPSISPAASGHSSI